MTLRRLASGAVLALALAPAAPAAASGTVANLSPPAITGKALVGQVLTVSQGTWAGSPTTFLYQWVRCAGTCFPTASEAPIGPPSSSNTYKLTEADAGHQLYALVQASNGTSQAVAGALPSADVGEANGAAPPVTTGSKTTTPGSTTIAPPKLTEFPPTAHATATPKGGTVVAFSAATSYARTPAKTIVSVRWSFGDGKIGSRLNTTHRYAKPGRYKVKLIVKDNLGKSSSTTLVIHVG